MSEQELVENETAELEAALSDDPAPVVETHEPEVETKSQQDRDLETGRFKAKAEQPDDTQSLTEDQQQALKPEGHADKPSDMVPVWRLNEVSQSKREAAARAEAAERRAQELERRFQEMEKAQQSKEPVQAPDMYQDPDAWREWVLQQSEAKAASQAEALVKRLRIEDSLHDARETHGELFDKAWAALEAEMAAGNRTNQMRVVQARNPGKELITWYKSNEFLREVGDPDQWRKQQEEAIRAKVLEELGTSPDRPKIKIPPSLTKVTASSGGDDAMLNMSEKEQHAAIFR